MYVVCVTVFVKPEKIKDFKEATLENAQGDSIVREDMALASLESGIALANSGLGAAHGFSGTLGGKYSIPHGLACACLRY